MQLLDYTYSEKKDEFGCYCPLSAFLPCRDEGNLTSIASSYKCIIHVNMHVLIPLTFVIKINAEMKKN